MSVTAIQKAALAIPFVLSALISVSASASAATANDVRCNGCVGNGDIGREAIKSDRIKDGQIKPRDLHLKSRPGGVNFSTNFGSSSVPTDAASVHEVELRVPTPGYALVNSSWYFAGSTATKCSCYLTNDAGTVKSMTSFVMSAGRSPFRDAGALTYVFPVEAGKETFKLVCSDDDTGATLYSVSMNALFVPNRYEPVQ